MTLTEARSRGREEADAQRLLSERVRSDVGGEELLRAAQGLSRKYRLQLALRRSRDELEGSGAQRFPAEIARARRSSFRSLAREFPGALRELERAPMVLFADRAARADEVVEALGEGRGGVEARSLPDYAPPAWLLPMADYHQSLRWALSLKRWIARRQPRSRGVEVETVAAFLLRARRLERSGAALAERLPADGEALTQLLNRIWLSPPESFVWSRLGERYGCGAQELQGLLFPFDLASREGSKRVVEPRAR